MTVDDEAGPVRRAAFSTDDPEVAEELVRRAYVENDLVVTGTRRDFRFRHHTVGAPGFAVDRIRSDLSMHLVAEATPDDPLLVITPHRGRLAYLDTGYGDTLVARGSPVLVPPHDGMRATCEQLDETLVPLDRDEVAAHAAATTGIEPDELEFLGLTPLSPALGRAWNATVAHVHDHVLADPWASTQPLVLDHAFALLAATLLSTFPNTALDRVTAPDAPPVRDDVPAAVLDEVVQYVHAHADRPVRPADLADLTGRPVPDVTAAMLRRDGRHPAEMLWRERLHGVRRALLAANPDPSGIVTTVRRVALTWGFTDAARFRAAYVRAFAEDPERTLAR